MSIPMIDNIIKATLEAKKEIAEEIKESKKNERF